MAVANAMSGTHNDLGEKQKREGKEKSQGRSLYQTAAYLIKRTWYQGDNTKCKI